MSVVQYICSGFTFSFVVITMIFQIYVVLNGVHVANFSSYVQSHWTDLHDFFNYTNVQHIVKKSTTPRTKSAVTNNLMVSIMSWIPNHPHQPLNRIKHGATLRLSIATIRFNGIGKVWGDTCNKKLHLLTQGWHKENEFILFGKSVMKQNSSAVLLFESLVLATLLYFGQLNLLLNHRRLLFSWVFYCTF